MKRSIELLKNKFEAELKGKVKGFYTGDPWVIPASNLPCLMISPEKTEIEVLDTKRDSNVHMVTVSIIIDARQYFNATPDAMVGTTFLMETMEDEDDLTGNIKSNTILGIIRDNLNLASNRFIQNVSEIDYTTRRRTEELITLEATAHLQVEHVVTR